MNKATDQDGSMTCVCMSPKDRQDMHASTLGATGKSTAGPWPWPRCMSGRLDGAGFACDIKSQDDIPVDKAKSIGLHAREYPGLERRIHVVQGNVRTQPHMTKVVVESPCWWASGKRRMDTLVPPAVNQFLTHSLRECGADEGKGGERDFCMTPRGPMRHRCVTFSPWRGSPSREYSRGFGCAGEGFET